MEEFLPPHLVLASVSCIVLILATCACSLSEDGNFGQANVSLLSTLIIWADRSTDAQYSTAKAAIIGFTRTLAIEGKRYNILANVIAPSAGTAMTMTIWYVTGLLGDVHFPNVIEGLKRWSMPSR